MATSTQNILATIQNSLNIHLETTQNTLTTILNTLATNHPEMTHKTLATIQNILTATQNNLKSSRTA